MVDHTQADDGAKPPPAVESGIGWIRGHALVRGNYVLVAVRVVARRTAEASSARASVGADAAPREHDTGEVLRYAIALANRLADANASPRRLDVEAVVDNPDSAAAPLWEELRVYCDAVGVDHAMLASLATGVLEGAGKLDSTHLHPGTRVVTTLLPPTAQRAVQKVQPPQISPPAPAKRTAQSPPSPRTVSPQQAVAPPPSALPPRAEAPATRPPRQHSVGRRVLVASVLLVVLGVAAVATLERAPSSEIAGVQAEPTRVAAPTAVPKPAATSTPVVAEQRVVPTAPPTIAPTQAPAATPTSPAIPTTPPAAPTVAIAPAALASPAPSAIVPRTLLDFSAGQTASLPWPNDTNSTAWFAPDGYHLVVQQTGRFVAIRLLSEQLRDVLVTATFRKTGGPSGGGYGIILRDPGPGPRDGLNQGGSYLVLEVGDRGEVGVWRRAEDRWVDVLQWTPAASVRPALGDNTLAIRAVGDRLTMSVNGTEVASTVDPSPARGSVGVFLGGDQNEALLTRLTIQSLD